MIIRCTHSGYNIDVKTKNAQICDQNETKRRTLILKKHGICVFFLLILLGSVDVTGCNDVILEGKAVAISFLFVSAACTSFHIHSPLLVSYVSLSYFNFTVHMRKCSGEHSCMSSRSSIAILNGTCSFRSAIPVLLN